ncbi:MAG: hypothetical protein ABWK53_10315 [Anaerolineales bacterium]
MTELEKCLFLISDALALPDPHPAIIYAARYLVTEYDSDDIPDWIRILANGKADDWESVVVKARRAFR